MYKFGQIEIASKEFNSQYEVTDPVDLEKIRISEVLSPTSMTLGTRLATR